MTFDPVKLYEWVTAAGFPGLLAVIIYASYKGIWVWGAEYREMKKERDEWKSFALNGTQLATRAVSLASKSANVTQQESPL